MFKFKKIEEKRREAAKEYYVACLKERVSVWKQHYTEEPMTEDEKKLLLRVSATVMFILTLLDQTDIEFSRKLKAKNNKRLKEIVTFNYSYMRSRSRKPV